VTGVAAPASETIFSRPGAGIQEWAPNRPETAAIAALPLRDVMARLRPARRLAAFDVVSFLLGSPPRAFAPNDVVVDVIERLCRLLIAAGLPLDRYGSSTTMITSEHDAVGRIWRRDKGVEQILYVSADEEDSEYLASPYRAASETRQWIELWLPDTPDERFGIVRSLKAQGFTHYICVPIWLSNGANGWITFATREASGFSQQDLLTIAFVVPALACRIDSRVGWSTLDKLLRTYVGDEPHLAILGGRAKRGQVTTIEAAMLVADLRDSTGLTADLTAVQAVDLFNELFDCLVPAIETRRGEVLKYLGDGLLAMFRDTGNDESAPDRALEAARAALEAIAIRNAGASGRRSLEVGIALHFGEIAYGNVGSGSRLDFTVIGRDVALATRIAGMNGKLRQPLLFSAAFAGRVHAPAERVGLYVARGFDQPIEVFRPVSAPRDSVAAADGVLA
jgi:adenylate cyclase